MAMSLLVVRRSARPVVAAGVFFTLFGVVATVTATEHTHKIVGRQQHASLFSTSLPIFAFTHLLRGGSDVDVDVDDDVAATLETNTEEIEETNEAVLPFEYAGQKDGDGSESDLDGLPRRFLLMQKGDRDKAKAALEYTLNWRKENNVNTILNRPHANFEICKAVLPHYFAGRDPTGHIMFVQRPGLTNLNLGHANNITQEDLLMHYVYTLEYCWNILEPRHDQTMTSVIDFTGVGLSTLRDKELMRFIKQFIGMMSLNYPSRGHKTLLLNTPRWFGALYKLISPILRESTKAKITIFSKGSRQDAALKEILGEDNVPTELLSSTVDDLDESAAVPAGSQSPSEEAFRKFCTDRTKEAGLEILPVVL